MSKVIFDVNKTYIKKSKRILKAQIMLDIQVAKDSNFYCPQANGDLIKSVLDSKYGSGKLVWDEKYAATQYYSKPNKSHDMNPNARMRWFEEAKSVNKKSWEKLSNDTYHNRA